MPCALCAQCRKDIKQICVRCGHTTAEQFHSSCFYNVEACQISSTRHMEPISLESMLDANRLHVI